MPLLAEVRALQRLLDVRARVAICLVLSLVAASPPARATASARPTGRVSGRLARIARVYRVSLRATVRNARTRDPAETLAVTAVVDLLCAALAFDRPVLAPFVGLAGLAISAEALSLAGWRGGSVDRTTGWAGAPFRVLTKVAVGVPVAVGLPPMRRRPLLGR